MSHNLITQCLVRCPCCHLYCSERSLVAVVTLSVGSSKWRSFQMKLVTSDPIPLYLALFQLVSQSVVGAVSLALNLMYWLGLLLLSSILMFFSRSTLYHCAVVLVPAFRECCPWLIQEIRRSWNRY